MAIHVASQILERLFGYKDTTWFTIQLTLRANSLARISSTILILTFALAPASKGSSVASSGLSESVFDGNHIRILLGCQQAAATIHRSSLSYDPI